MVIIKTGETDQALSIQDLCTCEFERKLCMKETAKYAIRAKSLSLRKANQNTEFFSSNQPLASGAGAKPCNTAY